MFIELKDASYNMSWILTGIGWTGGKDCRKADDRALQGLGAQPTLFIITNFHPKNGFTFSHLFSHHFMYPPLSFSICHIRNFLLNMIHCFMWKCIHYLFVYHGFPNLLLANASELQTQAAGNTAQPPHPPL